MVWTALSSLAGDSPPCHTIFSLVSFLPILKCVDYTAGLPVKFSAEAAPAIEKIPLMGLNARMGDFFAYPRPLELMRRRLRARARLPWAI